MSIGIKEMGMLGMQNSPEIKLQGLGQPVSKLLLMFVSNLSFIHPYSFRQLVFAHGPWKEVGHAHQCKQHSSFVGSS